MMLLALVFVVAAPVCFAFSIMIFVRNEWVYRSRVALIRTPYYERLPSYEKMLWRWWVWDINKFISANPSATQLP